MRRDARSAASKSCYHIPRTELGTSWVGFLGWLLMGYFRVCACVGAGVCEEIRFNLLIWLDLGRFRLEIRRQYYCTGFC